VECATGVLCTSRNLTTDVPEIDVPYENKDCNDPTTSTTRAGNGHGGIVAAADNDCGIGPFTAGRDSQTKQEVLPVQLSAWALALPGWTCTARAKKPSIF
jgi:hypothetical protein